MVYLNQVGAGSPVVKPNLFLDDLVITVPDGHNLVGNPNFEAYGHRRLAEQRRRRAVDHHHRLQVGRAQPGADRTDRVRTTARAGTCRSGRRSTTSRSTLCTAGPAARPDPAADLQLPGRRRRSTRRRSPPRQGRRQRVEPALRHGHLPARERAGRVQVDHRRRLPADGRRHRVGRTSVPISTSTMCRSPSHRNDRGARATRSSLSTGWRRLRRSPARRRGLQRRAGVHAA